MLVLTRRAGEAIFIGKDVQVCILGIKGSQVRLVVAAPPSVNVDREEVYRRKQQQNPPPCKR